MIVAAAVPIVFVVGTVLVGFENWFVLTTIYSVLLVVFGRGARTSMALSSCGYVARNNRSLCCCFIFFRLRTHNA